MNSTSTSTAERLNISQNPIENERLNNLRGMIHDLLLEGRVKVRFTKVNGEYREMICTLNAEMIPPQEVTEDGAESTRAVNPMNMSVWDLEKEGWRSFRLDSILGFSV